MACQAEKQRTLGTTPLRPTAEAEVLGQRALRELPLQRLHTRAVCSLLGCPHPSPQPHQHAVHPAQLLEPLDSPRGQGGSQLWEQPHDKMMEQQRRTVHWQDPLCECAPPPSWSVDEWRNAR